MALTKMAISTSDKKKKYTVQVNPDTITYKRSILTNEDKTAGKSEPAPTFKGYGPEEISFKIVFDGTGAISDPIGEIGATGGGLKGKMSPAAAAAKAKSMAAQAAKGAAAGVMGGEKPDDVIKMLEAFEDVVFDYQGVEHGPPKLKIEWGSFVIDECYLTTFDVTFTLFSFEGNPIRCTIDLGFKGITNKVTRAKKANNSSPDLTHIKMIRMGDELYLMCQDVYKDPKYYLQVAEKNSIINFRKLNAGDQILFPPLKK